jgi:hypothetical protein
MAYSLVILAQSNSNNEEKGIKFSMSNNIMYTRINHVIKDHVTHEDGTSHDIRSARNESGIRLGINALLGYRINAHWTTGVGVGGFFGIPEFYILYKNTYVGSYSLFAYGSYHFNNWFELEANLGVRKYNNNNVGPLLRLKPEFKVGDQMGLSIGIEGFLAKTNHVQYYVYEYEVYGDPNSIHLHDGYASNHTKGLIVDFGVVYRF